MPSNSTSKMFFYTYVLISLKDGRFYMGYTNDLRRRFAEHNSGKSFATGPRRPLDLIYYEACLNRDDAENRENTLKALLVENIYQGDYLTSERKQFELQGKTFAY